MILEQWVVFLVVVWCDFSVGLSLGWAHRYDIRNTRHRYYKFENNTRYLVTTKKSTIKATNYISERLRHN